MLTFKNFEHYLSEKAKIEPSMFKELSPYFSVRKVKKGEILLSKGEISKHIFFVEHGLLRFYAIDHKGKEHILQFAQENWWLTDRNNLCSKDLSTYYIDAYEESIIVFLNEEFIAKASELSDSFRAFHESILQKHIEQLYHRIYLLIGTSAKDRYLEFIKSYPQLPQRVPQWMIASYLGITPEGLSRIRKEIAHT